MTPESMDAPLFCVGARERLLQLAARPPRQVLSHDIGADGNRHENHGDPEVPVVMHMSPEMITTVPAAVLVAVRTLTHWSLSFWYLPWLGRRAHHENGAKVLAYVGLALGRLHHRCHWIRAHSNGTATPER